MRLQIICNQIIPIAEWEEMLCLDLLLDALHLVEMSVPVQALEYLLRDFLVILALSRDNIDSWIIRGFIFHELAEPCEICSDRRQSMRGAFERGISPRLVRGREYPYMASGYDVRIFHIKKAV